MALILSALVAVVSWTDVLWRWDLNAYDALVARWSVALPNDVVIVDIDEDSVHQLGRWPWPREVHAELVRALTRAEVQAIGLDILFSEPGDDRGLVRALQDSGRVVLPVAFATEGASNVLFELPPIPELAAAAAALGHADAELDRDAMARGVYLTAGLEHAHWPAFALAVLRVAGYFQERGNLPGVRNLNADGAAPGTWVRDHHILIPFAGPPGSFPRISYIDVLEGRVPKAQLRDRMVLVGVTATNLGAALPTPVSGESRPMAAVEFNANVLTALRSGLVITPMSKTLRLILSVILVVFPVALLQAAGARARLIGTAASMALVAAFTWLLLHYGNTWFSPVAALTGLACSYPLWSWRRLERVVESLAREKERAEVTLQSIGDGVVTTDVHQRVTYMNPVAEVWTGISREAANGRRLQEVLRIYGDSEMGETLEPAAHCLEDKAVVPLPQESVLVGRTGRRVALSGTVAPIRDRRGEISGVVLALSDVTNTRMLTERMAFRATHDDLTKLPNRTLLRDRLHQAIANARRSGRAIAVLFVDLDRFKTINDTLGHGSGDELLTAVAMRFQASTRAGDTVARLGGDEFVIVLQNVEHDEVVTTVARKLLELCPPPFMLQEHEICVTGSIGISMYPKDAEDSETLLKYADIAMYRAKDLGRNNFQFYAPQMNTWSRKRLDTEKQLRYAVERGELELHYQPQVNLDNGQVTGVEALLRWRHPEQGLIRPAGFLALAEETGLIIPIGEWVLDTVCRQSRRWSEEGLNPLRVAINLSASQFLQKDLSRLIADAAQRTALDPCYLELEITEAVIARDVNRVTAVMGELRELGASVSIDDFGTGYSSLSYLKRFPVDRVKIDQSFISDVASEPGDAAIALGVIAMGRGLDIEVVAEGVENRSQAIFLRDHECYVIQGNYFCGPKVEHELAEFLSAQRFVDLERNSASAANTLLLVDDDPDMLNLLESSLVGSGYEVLTATSGKESLEILARQAVGVIVCDEFMPQMSGNDLLRRVRKLYPDCVRILLSARQDPDSLMRAINESAIYRFLRKPLSSIIFQQTLRDAFLEYRMRSRGMRSVATLWDERDSGT